MCVCVCVCVCGGGGGYQKDLTNMMMNQQTKEFISPRKTSNKHNKDLSLQYLSKDVKQTQQRPESTVPLERRQTNTTKT